VVRKTTILRQKSLWFVDVSLTLETTETF